MDNKSVDTFQRNVGNLIARNRNLLDILTKCQISCGKFCRSTVKSATGCGCLKITGEKSPLCFTEESSEKNEASIEGKLCPDCRNIIENEIGESMFYIASLCNALGISLNSIMEDEIKKVAALGKYSLH